MIKPLLLIDLADPFKGFCIEIFFQLTNNIKMCMGHYITRRSSSNAPNSDNRIPIKQLMIL